MKRNVYLLFLTLIITGCSSINEPLTAEEMKQRSEQEQMERQMEIEAEREYDRKNN